MKEIENKIIRRALHLIMSPKFIIGKALMHYCPRLVSDKYFIQVQFKSRHGYYPNIDNPQTYNEKLQWLKLHDHNPLYSTLVDKNAVKKWLSSRYGEEHIIPTYGVYTNIDEIKQDALPDKFVLKGTHDCGSVQICHNKASFDWDDALDTLKWSLHANYYNVAREWPYKNVKPRIICEALLQTKEGKIPNDYKLFFINGEFQFVYVSYDREGVNTRSVFDAEWKKLPFVISSTPIKENKSETVVIPQPKSFEQMMIVGKDISQMFKTVRVDFYDVDGKMYFGEITLYHGSGYDSFYPEEYDLIYGQKLKLD